MGGSVDEFPLLSALGLYAADIRGDGMSIHPHVSPCVIMIYCLMLLPIHRQLSLQCIVRPTLWSPRRTPQHSLSSH